MSETIEQLQMRIRALEHELAIALHDARECSEVYPQKADDGSTVLRRVFNSFRNARSYHVCFCDTDGVAIIAVDNRGYYITNTLRSGGDIYLVRGQWLENCAAGWYDTYNDAVDAYNLYKKHLA